MAINVLFTKKSLPMPPYFGLILTKVYSVLQAHLFYGLPKKAFCKKICKILNSKSNQLFITYFVAVHSNIKL